MTDAEAAQKGALLLVAGGREDLRSGQSGNLDGGKPHSAGCSMNEDFFAALDFGEIVQGIPRSHEGDWDGGSLLMRES